LAQENPSFAGGYDPMARIVDRPIDPQDTIGAVAGWDAGAIATFLGTVRATTEARRVLYLEYEAYAPMAEKAMREIALAMPARFGPCRVAIEHRVGRLELGEISVAIAVASPHRQVALDACREAIERLKTTVPVWKKEHFEGGAVWIEGGRPPSS
jgi:molybdopterin synthase catalytic subunit